MCKPERMGKVCLCVKGMVTALLLMSHNISHAMAILASKPIRELTVYLYGID